MPTSRSPEQIRATVEEILDRRYPDPDDRDRALAAALDVHSSFAASDVYAEEWVSAKDAERRAATRAAGAIVAMFARGHTEMDIARRMKTTRMTVRRALGKST